MSERIVIVGGPLRGKTTTARLEFGLLPLYCTDKASEARLTYADTTYLPENISEEDRARYIASEWMTQLGPWVIEGVAAARALRKYIDPRRGYLRSSSEPEWPCDRVIVYQWPHPTAEPTTNQQRQAKGVWTVWQEIAERFAHITEYR